MCDFSQDHINKKILPSVSEAGTGQANNCFFAWPLYYLLQFQRISGSDLPGGWQEGFG